MYKGAAGCFGEADGNCVSVSVSVLVKGTDHQVSKFRSEAIPTNFSHSQGSERNFSAVKELYIKLTSNLIQLITDHGCSQTLQVYRSHE